MYRNGVIWENFPDNKVVMEKFPWTEESHGKQSGNVERKISMAVNVMYSIQEWNYISMYHTEDES
jgi:hypothetical protein